MMIDSVRWSTPLSVKLRKGAEVKKIAYLLGNTNGLPGIEKDLTSFQTFLRSGMGGAWTKDEILPPQKNISLRELKADFHCIKSEGFDYVLFYFSGHGNHARSTQLYINEQEEHISESELEDLAPKQLSIFDCCRLVERLVLENRFSSRPLVKNASELDSLYRMRFNRLLQAAAPQHLKLYSCRKGQCSIATGRGSLYTQCLLRTAIEKSETQNVSVEEAHDACKGEVIVRSVMANLKQEPDMKCVSDVDGNPLPFAVRKLQV